MKKRRLLGTTAILCVMFALTIGLSGQMVSAASPLTVYGDNLLSGWANWSWNTTVNFGATTPVHGGSKSISARYDAAWSGVYLRSNPAVAAGYDTLRFWVNGGSGSPKISVTFYDANSNAMPAKSFVASANTWMQVDVPLTVFGPSSNLWGVAWQDNSGAAQPVFYLDDIQLLTLGSTPQPPATGPVLRVDAAAGRHAISPYIYGLNFGDATLAADIKLPVNRWGGNATTRYNFKLDTSNHASDWYFENIPENNSNPGALPNGSSADNFVASNKGRGTDSIMTVPLIGWTPKSRAVTCGFSVVKYGAQQSTDAFRTDCGNGILTNGTKVTGNNPTDTSLAITPAFVQEWVNHLKGQFGAAGAGGVRFYNLDNEPALWNSTHRDVHPNPLSYDELRDRTYQYAAAIKASDPAAQTLGPAEWGWTNYFYSALDAAPGGSWWNNPADRNAHGGMELAAWYLDQMKKYEQTNGVRILDYLDLHYYPQASGVTLSSAGGQATQDMRLRTTRSLWDPTYLDESWINDKVRLLPRMRDWVNTYYPGTKLALTEYNFGGLEHINGAVTQADVLGIFGREGLDLANLWGPPTANQPGAYAFRMYRNYDGQGHMFGDTGVQSSSDDQSKLSVYGALRPDGALTIMVINKTTNNETSTLNLANFNGGVAQVYNYSAANLSQIVRGADVPVTAGAINTSYAAQSITLLVIPAGGVAPTASATPVPATATKTNTPPASATIPATASPIVTTSVPISGPPGTGWTMAFSDDFNGSALDTSKWNTCFYWATDINLNYCRAGNDELQWYQPDDVSVQNGLLHLKAEKRQVQGANYTSGMVASNNKFNYLYGYAEARVRVPKGKGLWPAFWTLPKDKTWPPEIDIMEILGDKPTVAYTTLHWGAQNNSSGKTINGPDFSADFHTFAADWEPGLIVWYIDGVEVFRLTANIPDKDMYLILNLAVGGAWPGSPDATTVFPSTFDVDYVRVWQKQNGAPTATATVVPPTASATVKPTFTLTSTATTVTPSATPTVPTGTSVPPSATPIPSTATATSVPPTFTATSVPASNTPIPASATPLPTGPTLTIQMNPTSAITGSTVSAALKLSNMSNLYGLQTECKVDPRVLNGVGHTEGDIFTGANSFIVDNAFQSDGQWSVAGSLLNPAPIFNGSGTAFSLNYKVMNVGHTVIECTVLAVDVNGNLLPVAVVNGSFDGTQGAQATQTPTSVPPSATPAPPTATFTPTLTATPVPTLTPMPGAISGVVKYEKRADQTGITAKVLSGGTPFAEGTSSADGSFQFNNVPAGSYVVQFSATGYLSASATVTVQAGQGATVQVTLLAGDIDGNGTVDLTDAGYIGANYRLQVPLAPAQADLNGDGFINLVDLVLVGKNFGKTTS